MDISLLPAELRTMIEEAVKSQCEKLLSSKDSIIARQQEEIAYLNEQIEWFRKKLFGSQSEKTIYIDPSQKVLFSSDSDKSNPCKSCQCREL